MNGRLVALAAAASFAVAAGVWWFAQGRQPAGLGLRVAEASGKCSVFSVQCSEPGKLVSGVLRLESPNGRPLTVGAEIRQGDRVAVANGGQVDLKYDAEKTWIGLEGAVATFHMTKDGGKYVQLERGRLTCLAAPQKHPFRIETLHGVASVIGTRFSIHVTDLKTDLSVVEGKVQCERAGQTLTVGPGQAAEASDQGLKIVSLPGPLPGLAYEFFGLYGNAELALQRDSGSTPDIGPYVGDVAERGRDWGLRFTGLLTPPADGGYAFRAEADSGVRVTIDGKPIIDGWAHDGARTGRATLTKVAPAAIVVEYFFIPAADGKTPEMRQMGGTTPTLRLFWTAPGGQEEPVPAAAYTHRPGVRAASATGKGETR